MGFRSGSYATVWSVNKGKFPNTTQVRLSTSRKNKEKNEYETDFSGFCIFYGDAAKQAEKLKERDRIRLVSVDVSNNYDKSKDTTYTNYKVFEFEVPENDGNKRPEKTGGAKKRAALDDGEPELDDENMPF